LHSHEDYGRLAAATWGKFGGKHFHLEIQTALISVERVSVAGFLEQRLRFQVDFTQPELEPIYLSSINADRSESGRVVVGCGNG